MKVAVMLFVLATAADAQQPARVSAGVMAGQLIHKVTPQFPQEAAGAHVNGTVVMHVLIGEDGTVKQVDAISGPAMLRPAYINAARTQYEMNAIRQWTYKPYTLNGQAVEVDSTIVLQPNFGG